MSEVLSKLGVMRVRAALDAAGAASAIGELPGAARTAQAPAEVPAGVVRGFAR